MKILQASFEGNSNIGLFCYATDSFCLVPVGMSKKLQEQFQKVLKVPVHEARVAGTNLLGAFLAGTGDKLLVPKIAFDNEIEHLESLGMKVQIVDSELTALGNNILCNEHGCIMHSDYPDKAVEQVEKFLGVPVKKGKIAGLDTVGSLATISGSHMLAHNEILDFEKKFLESALRVVISTGTVNFGSPYISSGIVCNKNGFVIGETSSGPEIANADEGLGHIEG